MTSAIEKIDAHDRNIINILRSEALSVKDCAARYTLHTLMFVGAALVGIGSLMKGNEHVALTSISLIFILRAISLTNTHKITIANRNLGYQLHLEFSINQNEKENSWQHKYRKIGWEEAMHAWRFFQTTIFEKICNKYPNAMSYRDPPDKKKGEEVWYDVNNMLPGEAVYYAGSAIRRNLELIHILMFASAMPMLVYFNMFRSDNEKLSATFAVAVITVTLFLYIWRSIYHDRVRLMQLEDGILSIPTCAKLWEATTIANYRAHNYQIQDGNNRKLSYYISEEANRLANNINDLRGWIDGKYSRRNSRETTSHDIYVNGNMKGKIINFTKNVSGMLVDAGIEMDNNHTYEEGQKIVFEYDELEIFAKVERARSNTIGVICSKNKFA